MPESLPLSVPDLRLTRLTPVRNRHGRSDAVGRAVLVDNISHNPANHLQIRFLGGIPCWKYAAWPKPSV